MTSLVRIRLPLFFCHFYQFKYTTDFIYSLSDLCLITKYQNHKKYDYRLLFYHPNKKNVHFYVHLLQTLKYKIMIVITPTELRSEQKKYLDLAEKEKVVIKRGSKLIELVVRERLITEEDLEKGISGKELLVGVREDIKEIYNR